MDRIAKSIAIFFLLTFVYLVYFRFTADSNVTKLPEVKKRKISITALINVPHELASNVKNGSGYLKVEIGGAAGKKYFTFIDAPVFPQKIKIEIEESASIYFNAIYSDVKLTEAPSKISPLLSSRALFIRFPEDIDNYFDIGNVYFIVEDGFGRGRYADDINPALKCDGGFENEIAGFYRFSKKLQKRMSKLRVVSNANLAVYGSSYGKIPKFENTILNGFTPINFDATNKKRPFKISLNEKFVYQSLFIIPSELTGTAALKKVVTSTREIWDIDFLPPSGYMKNFQIIGCTKNDQLEIVFMDPEESSESLLKELRAPF